MIPFHYMDMSCGWWFLPTIGFFIFMMLACILFRRVTSGGNELRRGYDFDRKMFGIEEMPPEQIQAHAHAVTQKIADTL